MRKPFELGPNGNRLVKRLMNLSHEEQQRVAIAGLIKMADDAIEFFTSMKEGAEEDVKSQESSFPDVLRAAAAIANKAEGPLMGSFIRGVLTAAGLDVEKVKAELEADKRGKEDEHETEIATNPELAMQAQREMDRLIKIFKGDSPA